MGPTLVVIFLAVFALAIGQAIARRKLNPYDEIRYPALPAVLRSEVERVLPGFAPATARLTKNGDEARLEGQYLGESMRVEADFDRAGTMVDFEVDGPRGSRTRGLAAPEDLPEPVVMEIERVLGDCLQQLERTIIKQGTSGSEPCFEVEGRSGDWKWEITVSASGRLLEVEREKRQHRR